MSLFQGGFAAAFSRYAGASYTAGMVEWRPTYTRPDGFQEALPARTLPIRYQRSERTFQAPDGSVVREDQFLVLQADLRREAAKARVAVPIAESMDLSAVLVDAEGRRFDALSVADDPARVYWAVTVRQLTGLPRPVVLFALTDGQGRALADDQDRVLVA